MSVHPVSIIKSYCESNGYQPGTPQENTLSKLLAYCFEPKEAPRTLVARELKPVPIYLNDVHVGFSHRSLVYVISNIPTGENRWVVKLETTRDRYKKQQPFFPYAEEVAYKISKLFGWTTVPKTTIFHQNDQVEKEPYRTFIATFIATFKDQVEEWPMTFTIQKFVTGEPLLTQRDIEYRSLGKIYKAPPVDSSSYQRAFLLEMILGKGDSRGDNIICSETGKFYEIDNEYLGCSFNPIALNALKPEKNKNVEEQVIEDVLKIRPEHLGFIQQKCSEKGMQLAQFWKNEVHRIKIPQLQEILVKNWDHIRENLTCVQRAINQLRGEKSGFTLAELEKYVQSLKKIATEKANREKAEINPKRLSVESSKLEDALSEANLTLRDIFEWIEKNHCVILHNANEGDYTYYQGPKTQLKDIIVIDIDIAPSIKLKPWDGLLASIKAAGLTLAPKAIQDQISNHQTSKEFIFLRIGY